MTDRERELETENRMLREQVASLEGIVRHFSQPAIQLVSQPLAPGAAPQPWWYPSVTWSSTDTTASGSPSAIT